MFVFWLRFESHLNACSELLIAATQDWTACSTGASQSSGYTTVYASRLVVTGDKKQDRDIPQGTVPIVIAWGGSDSLGQHASDARMMASVKFYGSNYAEYSTTVTSAINPQTYVDSDTDLLVGA